MSIVLSILIGVLCIGGALFVLISAWAMLRARDGLSRINVMSGATGMGMPWMVTGVYIHHVWVHGFSVVDLIKLFVAIAGFIILSSVASNSLGRATYRSGAPLDPATDPNDLA
ncbi:Na(+) H(+) antiporter subunit G [Serinicoccus hydrothermalis]|uniref:Na(+) H(+) antiporter subunit G n=1 Tax=Serinicoccus hydrothermalis TaxID=1758689 RepID=A0A1B1NBY6_9MICO|nr:monovalent cation/H(+) antiporter subunit G [Serinicoccus hydrothermalis]ANS78914.1 Na(+) H(+) antiporter subunit G [Serinicoccus hydrothermalis]